jgi:DNA primase
MSADNSISPVQADLVQIISKYILLEESRKHLKGRCPFHKDLATSLMVSPDKNIFQCFGCGKGGGPVEFVMAIENKTREEAIHLIATQNPFKAGGQL